jgi:hypothetical protein
MSRWPWITILLGIAAVLNPIGLGFIDSAFFAGEALSRNIARPIFLTAAAIWGILVLIEFFIRLRIHALRQKRAAQTSGAARG